MLSLTHHRAAQAAPLPSPSAFGVVRAQGWREAAAALRLLGNTCPTISSRGYRGCSRFACGGIMPEVDT